MSQQGSHLEIERRWLLDGLLEAGTLRNSAYLWIRMWSVYLLIEPTIEVRLRRAYYYNIGKDDSFCLETKLGAGLSRQETPKLAVDPILFNDYFRRGRFPCLEKDHLEFLITPHLKLELNLFSMPFSILGLALVEVEFKSEEDAIKFDKKDFPSWLNPHLIKEVTDDPRYNGKNLAMNGRPNPA